MATAGLEPGTPPAASDEGATAHPGVLALADARAAPRGREPANTAPEQDLLLREKVRGMFSYNTTSLAGHAIGAIVIEAVYAAAPLRLRLGWGTAFALVWALRVWLATRLAGPLPAERAALVRARNVWVAGILTGGALWGWAGWHFFEHGDALEQIALIVVVYTFCVACLPILAPQFRLYLAFVALVDLPVIGRVALSAGGTGPEIAFVLLVAMAMTIVLGRNYRDAFEALARLQRKNESLVVELRAETGEAEAARGQAEVANRAKTQFFAAASHDLRQPLHAMGLFAEALRQRVREPEVAQLVTSINESVDALEGLFSELLDITRIDSGGVAVRPEGFSIGALQRRIRLHFEPAAFDKGLALRFRGGAHAAHADPLLVERILRNLVSNAIRYTDDGSVLVGCRRRGAHLLLQVWDTGPGIAPADRQRIFDEFYQLPATQHPTAEQRKGLGLGLAIVKRLADLIEAPLTLASTPGRGSVFTLELPVGIPPAEGAAAVAGRPAGLATLAGRSILVVEDDDAVRAGLAALLTGWGAEVAAHERLETVRRWVDTPDGRMPDLLIVDYRLGDGSTGLDAVRLVRERFRHCIPAIVVTGSLLTSDAPESQLADLHVLLKPVLPNKLRAMVAFKLAARAASGPISATAAS